MAVVLNRQCRTVQAGQWHLQVAGKRRTVATCRRVKGETGVVDPAQVSVVVVVGRQRQQVVVCINRSERTGGGVHWGRTAAVVAGRQ